MLNVREKRTKYINGEEESYKIALYGVLRLVRHNLITVYHRAVSYEIVVFTLRQQHPFLHPHSSMVPVQYPPESQTREL